MINVDEKVCNVIHENEHDDEYSSKIHTGSVWASDH